MANRQIQGKQKQHVSTKVDEDTGMTIFLFSDGADWLSQVPWLSAVEDADTSKKLVDVERGVTKTHGRE